MGELSPKSVATTFLDTDYESDDEDEDNPEGLGTGQRRLGRINQAPPASPEVENFLAEAERALIGTLDDDKRSLRRRRPKKSEI